MICYEDIERSSRWVMRGGLCSAVIMGWRLGRISGAIMPKPGIDEMLHGAMLNRFAHIAKHYLFLVFSMLMQNRHQYHMLSVLVQRNVCCTKTMRERIFMTEVLCVCVFIVRLGNNVGSMPSHHYIHVCIVYILHTPHYMAHIQTFLHRRLRSQSLSLALFSSILNFTRVCKTVWLIDGGWATVSC